MVSVRRRFAAVSVSARRTRSTIVSPNGARLPTTRRRIPTSLSLLTYCSSAPRKSCFSTETSSAGRRQFSELNANRVKYSTPRSPQARTVARTASLPRWCPATRGRNRFFAQRPLPSMMMAIWRGTAPVCGMVWVVLSCIGLSVRVRGDLHVHEIGFLLLQRLFDLRDIAVGQLLDVVLGAALLILRKLVFLQHLLEMSVRIAAQVADRHARVL